MLSDRWIFLLCGTLFFLLTIGSFATANTTLNELYFSDYRAIQRVLRNETKSVESQVDDANRNFIAQISRYGRCDSNKWRAVFEIALSELNDRRKELDGYKRNALDTKGKLNATWIKTAKEVEIRKVRADQSITDFVIWYENFASDMRQGPLQELKIYTLGMNKLSEAYEKMSLACEGDPEAANDSDVWAIGVRGLIAEVTGMLGLSG